MKRLAITILTALALILPAVPAVANAASSCGAGNSSKGQVLQGVNASNNDACNDSGINQTIAAAVNILSFIVGVAAIIAIISAGFKYITSGGDSNKVGNAKSTILYAIVGLVVVALAQLIIRVVVHTTSNAANSNCSSSQHYDSSANKCVAN